MRMARSKLRIARAARAEITPALILLHGLPQGDIILCEMLPDTSLGLGGGRQQMEPLARIGARAASLVAYCHRLRPSPRCAADAQRAGSETAQRLPMANPYRPETLRGMAATNTLQIATLIGDLWQSVEVLTADIEHEEMHSGVRNVADPTYPVAGAKPEVAEEQHPGDHCYTGGGNPREAEVDLSRHRVGR